VLDAFRAHLFGAGLSPKVVERDLTNVTVFAEGFLAELSEPVSLRDFGAGDLIAYVEQVQATPGIKEARVRELRTGFKRFLKFLRDSGRMDYDSADYALDWFAGRLEEG